LRTLERLSDPGLARLAVATNLPGGPAPTLAPMFWSYFGDIVAHECARRHGMVGGEPTIPELPAHDLKNGILLLTAIAEAERAAGATEDADVLIQIAEEGALIRKTGLFEVGQSH
jgi:hypothetical protein